MLPKIAFSESIPVDLGQNSTRMNVLHILDLGGENLSLCISRHRNLGTVSNRLVTVPRKAQRIVQSSHADLHRIPSSPWKCIERMLLAPKTPPCKNFNCRSQSCLRAVLPNLYGDPWAVGMASMWTADLVSSRCESSRGIARARISSLVAKLIS